MIQITFERASLPLGPHAMMAYFPRGRKMLTTQAVVRHMRVPLARVLTLLPTDRHDDNCQRFENRSAEDLRLQGYPTQRHWS